VTDDIIKASLAGVSARLVAARTQGNAIFFNCIAAEIKHLSDHSLVRASLTIPSETDAEAQNAYKTTI
jgi:hypothetical protein